MESKQETLRLWHADGKEHRIVVCFAANDCHAILEARYDTGTVGVEHGAYIARWRASYEHPNQYDKGHAQLGDGRIDIEVEALRGIGLGSLLMRPFVSWVKSHAQDVPMVPINLAADDAKTGQERDIRNQFYVKLGYRFEFKDADYTWGESRPMLSLGLITPPFRLSRGWRVESVDGAGEVF